MKKCMIWVLSLCMITSLSGTATVFADTAQELPTEVGEEAAVTYSAITLEPISLSLKGAYKQLETSKTMELIKLSQQSDQSVAKGYGESVSSYNKMEKSDDLIPGYDSSNKNVAQARRTFATAMIDVNNQARINSMNQEAFQKYYNLKNAETQKTIAREGLALKKSLYETTSRKYAVGTASKTEVQNAEKNFKDAESQLKAVENSLEQLKRSFNTYLGYSLSQKVVLIDEIEEIPMPETKPEDAIALALSNRTEIKQADYNVQIAELNFNSYKAYPSSSSKYLTAKTQLLNAEIAKENKPTEIESDVRKKYDDVTDSYNSVQSGKEALQSAEDSLATATRKFDLGMVTMAEVQQAQLALNNAKLTQANSLLSYNLAVENYNLSMGVGITPANI